MILPASCGSDALELQAGHRWRLTESGRGHHDEVWYKTLRSNHRDFQVHSMQRLPAAAFSCHGSFGASSDAPNYQLSGYPSLSPLPMDIKPIRLGQMLRKACAGNAALWLDEGNLILSGRQPGGRYNGANLKHSFLSHWVAGQEPCREFTPAHMIGFKQALACMPGYYDTRTARRASEGYTSALQSWLEKGPVQLRPQHWPWHSLHLQSAVVHYTDSLPHV